MRGKLEVKCRDAVTKEVVSKIVKNLVLNNMFAKLVGFLGGKTTGYVNRIQLGVGTRIPVVTDDSLQSPITPMLNVSATYHDAIHAVVFFASLGTDEGNGFPISEAGLVTDDDVLVTRTTFPSRMKSNKYVFTFNWTIFLRPS